MSYPKYIKGDERKIIDAILNEAVVKRGLAISVFDGEETVLVASSDLEAITSEIGATEETTLRLRNPLENNKLVGNIWLVHGNGYDVVCDHSESLCEFMEPIDALIEELAA